MQIAIFQIAGERDKNNRKFRDLLPSQGLDAGSYEEVFRGDVDCENLEDVYQLFNTDGHPLHRGHSLSVSDVVVTQQGAFCCQSVGFQKVSFDEAMTHKPDDLLRVVYVEPGKPAYEAEIGRDLKSLQRAVKGYIECVNIGEKAILVCNEEGKLIGMEGNRRLDSGAVIAGPFFIVRSGYEDFESLTDKQVQEYLNEFAQPHEISQSEVEADMGYTIISY